MLVMLRVKSHVGQNIMNQALLTFTQTVRLFDLLEYRFTVTLTHYIQSAPLATEPGIFLIILTPMKILQRNLNRSTFVV